MRIDGTRSNDRATEVVLAYLSALNRADWAAVLALLVDDVVHDFDGGQHETGKAAFAASLHGRVGQREQLRDIVVMSSPNGARAAAEFVAHGEAEPGAGQSYRRPGGLFFSIRDGQIERVSNYQTRSAQAARTGTPA